MMGLNGRRLDEFFDQAGRGVTIEGRETRGHSGYYACGFGGRRITVREYSTGEAYVEVEGVGVTSLVVFGAEDSTPLLGVTTLELLGLQADPATGKLSPWSFSSNRPKRR